MARSTPNGIRLIKKFNWKSKWYIDNSKKNSYIRSLYDDYAINEIINNLYHYYSWNNIFIFRFKYNKFLKFYYSNVYVNRSQNTIKIYYFYCISFDFIKKKIKYPFIKNYRKNKTMKYLLIKTYKQKYLTMLRLKNNIQLLTGEFVRLIYIRKRRNQNNLDFMWNLLEIFYINQYRLGKVLGIFLNKIWFNTSRRRTKFYKGFKLKIKGKMRGKDRTKTIYKNFGGYKTNIFNSEIQYLFKPISNVHGSYGIKLWLLLSRNKNNNIKLINKK